jgi:hypothetical protein
MGDLNVHAIDLDKMDEEDGALIQMELLQQTGQRTVPNSECACAIRVYYLECV